MKYFKAVLFAGLSLFPLTLLAQVESDEVIASGLYQSGYYIGGQIGYVELNNSHTDFFWSNILFPLISKTGSRLFGGYTFNDYFALEAGYNFLADGKETGGVSNREQHAYVSGCDMLGKGILPLNRYFSVFVKGGLAYIIQDILDATDGGATVAYRSNTHQWMLTAAPGIDIHITQHFILEGAYTRFFQRKDIHNIDVYSLGLSYTF